MALTVLYHGTDVNSAIQICKNQKADVNIGSKKVDFGPGFYTTDDKQFVFHTNEAVSYIKKYMYTNI